MSAFRRVVLSGASGFLGSHLTRALLKAGCDVTILTRKSSNLDRISDILSRLRNIQLDRHSIDCAFSGARVDAVIHVACNYGRRGESFEETLQTNLFLAVRILAAAIRADAAVFINTDTTLPQMLNPYALSKHQFIEWLGLQSGLIRTVNLRLDQMYGPGDDVTKFVPWLLRQLVDGVEFIPLTLGEQLRDFVHVDDVVRAYVHFLKTPPIARFSTFDVGTGRLTSLKQFVNLSKTEVNFNLVRVHIAKVKQCVPR